MHLSKMSKLSELHFTDIDCVMPVGFWSAIDVWIKKPHVVNKRLCGAKQDETTEVNVCELKHMLSASWCSATEELNTIFSFLNNGVDNAKTISGRWCCVIRTLIPKVNSYGNSSHKEIVLKDVSRQCITFLPFEERGEENSVPRKSNVYQIRFKAVNTTEWSVEISTLRPDEWFSDGVVYPKLPWLSSELLPKLVRWSTESRTSEFKSTLSLIPLEKYSLLYQRLKERYKEMVKVWPEVTDPEKFVYEDVAIATYLLVLWEGERAEKGLTAKQSFVDLGCGNGLLVHILSNEGHPGKGIDVRKRKIWDTYGPQTRLEESAITPSESCLFPDADWLIGNHSDELTPWIPVISSRSSYTCQYFVLPCCFFDFNGKYQRRQCKTSQYKEYVDFVSEVGSVCGFQVDEDCLRIPSTKRVCLIGRSRSYEPSGEAQVDVLRTQYIEKRLRNCAVGSRSKSATTGPAGGGSPPSEHRAHGHSGADWGGGFQPREKIESVRNCASLPRDFVDGIVLQVALALLGLKSEESCDKDKWNQGGSLLVREVAELLEKGTLHTLKKECGGLQTLLKNNHQVFRVEGGSVRIRDWRAPAGERRARPGPRGTPEDYRKTQPCWFHTHHPQGCPLLAGSCAFAHGPEELRPSARLSKKRKNM